MGEQAGATSVAGAGGRGPTWATSAKQLKASPFPQDQLNCCAPSPPAEGAPPPPPSISRTPSPHRSLLLRAHPHLPKSHFHSSPTSPRGISPGKGRLQLFSFHLEQFRV